MQGSKAEVESGGLMPLESALNAVVDMVIVLNEADEVTFANETARRWLGGETQLLQHSLVENRPVLRETYDLAKRLEAPSESEIELGGMHFEWRFFPKDGSLTVMIRDVSTRKRHEAEMMKQIQMAQQLVSEVGTSNAELIVTSERDGLTGLNNRRRYNEFSKDSFGLTRARGQVWAVTVLDVDSFKSFNDEFGHECGDTVLKAVSEILKDLAEPHEFVSRYGGEEFVIISAGVPMLTVMEKADYFRHAISQIRGLPREVTASFGVATTLNNDLDPEQVFQRADSAMYAAKKAGKNCVKLHPKDAHSHKLMQWSYSIRKYA